MRFVCWLWRGRDFWKPTARYRGEHVTTLARMLARFGHDLTCITDDPGAVPDHVDRIAMPEAVAALPDYLPKLWAWSPYLHGLIGERFASIDLDSVVVGDPAPLLDGPEPIILWDRANLEPYNTSLFALDPGAGHEVWTAYSPERLEKARRLAPYWTGDQSWVAHVLGANMPTFGEADGIIQYRPRLHRDGNGETLPAHTRVAFMPGPYEPFSEQGFSEWVSQHYR